MISRSGFDLSGPDPGLRTVQDWTRVCGRFWTRSFSSRHLLPENVVPAGVNLDGLVVVF